MVTELTFLCAIENRLVTELSSHTPKPFLTIICLSSLGQNPFSIENSTTFLSRLDLCFSVLTTRKPFLISQLLHGFRLKWLFLVLLVVDMEETDHQPNHNTFLHK